MNTLKRGALKNITVAIPNHYCKAIEFLINMGMVTSRSEFLRNAIREMIDDELNHKDDLHVPEIDPATTKLVVSHLNLEGTHVINYF